MRSVTCKLIGQCHGRDVISPSLGFMLLFDWGEGGEGGREGGGEGGGGGREGWRERGREGRKEEGGGKEIWTRE